MSINPKKSSTTELRIYHAALGVFRRRGFAAARLDEIATRAKVSRPSFYVYFPGKDDVLARFLRERQDAIAAEMTALPIDASLAQVFDTYSSSVQEHWKHDRALVIDACIVGMKLYATTADARQTNPVRAAFVPLFERAQARGELNAMLPGALLADFFLSNALGAMLAWGADDSMSLKAYTDGVAMLFLNGAAFK